MLVGGGGGGGWVERCRCGGGLEEVDWRRCDETRCDCGLKTDEVSLGLGCSRKMSTMQLW